MVLAAVAVPGTTSWLNRSTRFHHIPLPHCFDQHTSVTQQQQSSKQQLQKSGQGLICLTSHPWLVQVRQLLYPA